MATQVTAASFQQEVLDKKGVVFVDFYADWCGPCKMVEPIIEEMSKDMTDVSFVKVDVDAEGELAGQYNVSSIPTFYIFKDGKVVSQMVGAQGREGFEEELEKAKNA